MTVFCVCVFAHSVTSPHTKTDIVFNSKISPVAPNSTIVYGLPFSIAHFMIIQRHNHNASGFGGILQVMRIGPALLVMFVAPYRRFPMTRRKSEVQRKHTEREKKHDYRQNIHFPEIPK